MAESLILARELVEQGVETVVCTPHWSRSFPTAFAKTRAAGESLRTQLRREGLALDVIVSAELSDVVAATRPIAEIRERSLAGRAAIFELVAGSLIVHAAAIVSRLVAAGLMPVIAHPERCAAVQEDPTVLEPLRVGGAWIQVVAPSLTGRSGGRARAAAWALLESGGADLVASDAHDVGTRRCELREAGDLVIGRLGQARWTSLTDAGPRDLLARPAATPTS